MQETTKPVLIGEREYEIAADGYGVHLGDRFEPNTATLLTALCEPTSQVLDIGANIGITAILFAALAAKAVAVEPVPTTFARLKRNLAGAGITNVTAHQFALGASEGTAAMQGNPNDASGSFVADRHKIKDTFHFTEHVPVHRLDDVFGTLGLDRVDLMKIDVEGYELNVLQGAKDVLQRFRPIVVLELNYVTLNLWQRMSVPEFLDRLLAIFPCVFGVDGTGFLDLREGNNAHEVQFAHLTRWAYMDIVAGFDARMLRARLATLPAVRARLDAAAMQLAGRKGVEQAGEQLRSSQAQCETLATQLAAAQRRVLDLERSTSWRITAPLRALARLAPPRRQGAPGHRRES